MIIRNIRMSTSSSKLILIVIAIASTLSIYFILRKSTNETILYLMSATGDWPQRYVLTDESSNSIDFIDDCLLGLSDNSTDYGIEEPQTQRIVKKEGRITHILVQSNQLLTNKQNNNNMSQQRRQRKQKIAALIKKKRKKHVDDDQQTTTTTSSTIISNDRR